MTVPKSTSCFLATVLAMVIDSMYPMRDTTIAGPIKLPMSLQHMHGNEREKKLGGLLGGAVGMQATGKTI